MKSLTAASFVVVDDNPIEMLHNWVPTIESFPPPRWGPFVTPSYANFWGAAAAIFPKNGNKSND